MEYFELPPAPDLADHVRTYWWLRGVPDASIAPEPALPDGSPEFIVNLGAPWEQWRADGTCVRQPNAFLVGQILGPMTVRPTGPVDLVAVRFESHAAALLVDAIGELTDCWREIGQLRGGALDGLPRALALAPNVEAQRALLDSRLRSIADEQGVDALMGRAVRAIRDSHGAIEIDRLARTLGITPRTLQRRFSSATGLTPKQLARIVRFQRVFAAWRDDPASLSRVALESGYFDQSHLVRDFRAFAGAPPANFLSALPAFTAFFTAAGAALRAKR